MKRVQVTNGGRAAVYHYDGPRFESFESDDGSTVELIESNEPASSYAPPTIAHAIVAQLPKFERGVPVEDSEAVERRLNAAAVSGVQLGVKHPFPALDGEISRAEEFARSLDAYGLPAELRVPAFGNQPFSEAELQTIVDRVASGPATYQWDVIGRALDEAEIESRAEEARLADVAAERVRQAAVINTKTCEELGVVALVVDSSKIPVRLFELRLHGMAGGKAIFLFDRGSFFGLGVPQGLIALESWGSVEVAAPDFVPALPRSAYVPSFGGMQPHAAVNAYMQLFLALRAPHVDRRPIAHSELRDLTTIEGRMSLDLFKKDLARRVGHMIEEGPFGYNHHPGWLLLEIGIRGLKLSPDLVYAAVTEIAQPMWIAAGYTDWPLPAPFASEAAFMKAAASAAGGGSFVSPNECYVTPDANDEIRLATWGSDPLRKLLSFFVNDKSTVTSEEVLGHLRDKVALGNEANPMLASRIHRSMVALGFAKRDVLQADGSRRKAFVKQASK